MNLNFLDRTKECMMRQLPIRRLIVPLLLAAATMNAFAWPIPDTGQTTCYDENGNVISCTGTGQDGEYLINPPSYTKLAADGTALPDSATDWVMVRDNVTGLIWEVKQNWDLVVDFSNPHDADNTYTWYDSNPETNGGDAGESGDGTDTEDFVAALNTAQFGGFHNWRLPSWEELRTILDYSIGHPGPCLNINYFPNSPVSLWSSTSTGGSGSYAYVIHTNTGEDAYDWKDKGKGVRAVCGQQTESQGRLMAIDSETVLDIQSGLMWWRGFEYADWASALTWSEHSELNGYTDWRLPTIKELQSIMLTGVSPSINTHYFMRNFTNDTQTSTTSDSYSDKPWLIDFSNGLSIDGDGYYGKDRGRYFHIVRGGQNEIPGHLIIHEPRQAAFWQAGSDLPIAWDTATPTIPGNVKISISYDGGKPGSFETIAASTPNDGAYPWHVPETLSFNCMLKIEPLSDPTKGTVQGLFSIVHAIRADPGHLVLQEPATPTGAEASESFNIRLESAPSAAVEMILQSSNPGEFTVSPETAILDAGNWDTGVQITVTPVYDGIPDGDQQSAVLVSTNNAFGPFQARDLRLCGVTVRDANTTATLDSVYPTYGLAGQPLAVTLKGTAFTAATPVYVYPEGGTPSLVAPITLIGPDAIEVTIPAQSAGDYHLSVGTASELKNALTFTDAATLAAQDRKKAIIVAGGASGHENGLWLATEKTVKKAYEALTFQGYDADTIQLLSRQLWFDMTGDGQNDVDADATAANLQAAIAALSSATVDELLLFLTGPGGDDTFQFGSDANPDTLAAASLDTWLDALQQATTCDVVVIYDACMSGSFMADLDAPSGLKRTVMAGASPSERAGFLDDGEQSFSYRLFSHFFHSGDLDAAFTSAKQDVAGIQTALIDNTGDGVPDDLKALSVKSIEKIRGVSDGTDPPHVGDVTADPEELQDGLLLSTISATEVSADNGLSHVWCRIMPPAEIAVDPNAPLLALPTMKLLDWNEDNIYENDWEPFDQKGVYRIVAYAIDLKGYQSLPGLTTVTQHDGDDPFPDPPSVAGIALLDADPTFAPELRFEVTFSRPVFGVDPTDFAPHGDGLNDAGMVSAVTGGPEHFTVTVSGVSGTGTLRLDVLADGTIHDESGDVLTVPYVDGPAYTVTETPQILVAPLSMEISEPDGAAKFRLSLTVSPLTPVHVGLINPDFSECQLSIPEVMLDETNWQTGVDVIVQAVHDHEKDGEQSLVIATMPAESGDARYAGIDPPDVNVTVNDDPDALERGDFNASGEVDLDDVLLALKTVAGMETAPAVAADVDGNDKIGLIDALYALRKAAGL